MNMRWMYLLSLVIVSSAKVFDDFDEEDFIPFTGKRHDQFDWLLCSAIDDVEPGNMIASTVSIKLLLTMIYEASIGSTEQELKNILQIEFPRDITRSLTNALLKTLRARNPHYNLDIAMRLYTGGETKPKNWYKNILAQYYGTYVTPLDFRNPALAASDINAWVEHTTHGHVKNLIEDSETLKNTNLLLVSAVFFRGKWKSSFPLEDSYNGVFQSPGGPKPSRFMSQSGLFYYAESDELDAKVLRLPYEGNKFAMYVILPRRKDGINQTLATVRPFILRRVMGLLEETSVSVTLPIFQFKYTMDLKQILMDMGLTTIFSHFDEFRGFNREKKNQRTQLAVSNIFQKASIVVNEEGTIAAAATGIEFVSKIGIPDLIFNASHPFLFYIEDERTGTVIFEGKFMYPDVTTAQLVNPSLEIIPKNNAFSPKPTKRRSVNETSHHHRRKGELERTEWKMSKTP